jgi:hypothetical protein
MSNRKTRRAAKKNKAKAASISTYGKISEAVREDLLEIQDNMETARVQMAAMGANFDRILLEELQRLRVKGIKSHLVCLECGLIRHNSIPQCPCERR